MELRGRGMGGQECGVTTICFKTGFFNFSQNLSTSFLFVSIGICYERYQYLCYHHYHYYLYGYYFFIHAININIQ